MPMYSNTKTDNRERSWQKSTMLNYLGNLCTSAERLIIEKGKNSKSKGNIQMRMEIALSLKRTYIILLLVLGSTGKPFPVSFLSSHPVSITNILFN